MRFTEQNTWVEIVHWVHTCEILQSKKGKFWRWILSGWYCECEWAQRGQVSHREMPGMAGMYITFLRHEMNWEGSQPGLQRKSNKRPSVRINKRRWSQEGDKTKQNIQYDNLGSDGYMYSIGLIKTGRLTQSVQLKLSLSDIHVCTWKHFRDIVSNTLYAEYYYFYYYYHNTKKNQRPTLQITSWEHAKFKRSDVNFAPI